MSGLAIIIVSYNASADLARCLESLSTAPPVIPHDVVVVDNASTDGAPLMVRERFPAVRVIDAGANLGFSHANNIGIRATAGDLVLLLNPDTVVPPGSIDRLAGRLLAGDAVAAGPRLVDGHGHAELSFGHMYSPAREAVRKLTLALDSRGVGPVRSWIERATSRERYTDWVTGACLLVRREAGDAVGWLDERYFMYAEDVDFCAALRARGGRVLFTPAAEIVHLRGRSGLSAASATRRAWHESHLAFYRKHLPDWAPWLEWYLRRRE